MIRRHEEGYTLIEMVVTVVITGLIGSLLATSIFQFSVVTKHSTDQLEAVTEIQTAANWYYPDAQRAVNAGTALRTGDVHLNLSIIDPSGTISYASGTLTYNTGTVSYWHDAASSNLKREVVVPPTPLGSGTVNTIARGVSVSFDVEDVPDNMYLITMYIEREVEGKRPVSETFRVYRDATGTPWE